jgi:LmbE family N-acetylglucosaminyl deacetylase
MHSAENILIVAPHADDEILGCGGIISRYKTEGNNVFVAIMTNASIGAPKLFSKDVIENVRKEALAAHNFLNVNQTFFYEFPAPDLMNHPSFEISIELDKLIRHLKISILFIPHRGDMHKDHAIIYYSSLVAARPINDCPIRSIYAYETLSETEWASPFADESFMPNVFIDISNDLTHKLKAMQYFESQLKDPPHPRSLKTIEALATFRGATIGVKYAEAFMLIRIVK